MWIVRLALRRPYTFVVMAILILIMGIARNRSHPNGHFSEHQHSSCQHHLEL